MFDFGGLRIMGKLLEIKYNDVDNFSRQLNRVIKSKRIDDIFIESCKVAMDNTLSEAELRTPVATGELYSSWRRDVERPQRQGDTFSQTATNKAFNEEAAAVGMEGHYASFVEEGHKPVPWRKNTHGVHMLAQAENDTENLLEEIVDDEINKVLGGIFK